MAIIIFHNVRKLSPLSTSKTFSSPQTETNYATPWRPPSSQFYWENCWGRVKIEQVNSNTNGKHAVMTTTVLEPGVPKEFPSILPVFPFLMLESS